MDATAVAINSTRLVYKCYPLANCMVYVIMLTVSKAVPVSIHHVLFNLSVCPIEPCLHLSVLTKSVYRVAQKRGHLDFF